MKILFAASEVAPFAKTGGLADVAGSLPRALAELGHQVEVVLPRHAGIARHDARLADSGLRLKIRMGRRHFPARVLELLHDSVRVLFIEQRELFNRPDLYGYSADDWPENALRYGFFCRAVLHMLRERGERPDLLHLNDWQTALIPLLLKTELGSDPFFAGLRSLLTIHNLGYQGTFAADSLRPLDLPTPLFHQCRLGPGQTISLLKAGLLFADRLNTVSPSYAREILTDDFGCGLAPLLRQRQSVFNGILNGLDIKTWDPRHDPELAASFHADNLEGKRTCKRALQEELGLAPASQTPLAAVVSRIDRQKGLDLLADIWNKLRRHRLQLVLLGSGDRELQEQLRTLADTAPSQTALHFGFDEGLAHRIYAGADLFLMPSRYEPCGLSQLIALRYGTVPLVRNTGGLADTIGDVDADPDLGTGFSFDAPTGESLLNTIDRALRHYRAPGWSQLVSRCMRCDFSWDRSARAYSDLYRLTLEENSD